MDVTVKFWPNLIKFDRKMIVYDQNDRDNNVLHNFIRFISRPSVAFELKALIEEKSFRDT